MLMIVLHLMRLTLISFQSLLLAHIYLYGTFLATRYIPESSIYGTGWLCLTILLLLSNVFSNILSCIAFSLCYFFHFDGPPSSLISMSRNFVLYQSKIFMVKSLLQNLSLSDLHVTAFVLGVVEMDC